MWYFVTRLLCADLTPPSPSPPSPPPPSPPPPSSSSTSYIQYFPCNAAVSIKDDKAQLTIVVDASQGVASIKDGSIELMVS